jgi:hypothetical protein
MGESIEFTLLTTEEAPCNTDCFKAEDRHKAFTCFIDLVKNASAEMVQVVQSELFDVPQIHSPLPVAPLPNCATDGLFVVMPFCECPKLTPLGGGEPQPDVLCQKREKYNRKIREVAYDHACFETMTFDVVPKPDAATSHIDLVTPCGENDAFLYQLDNSNLGPMTCSVRQEKFLTLQKGLHMMEADFSLSGKWNVVYSFIEPDTPQTKQKAAPDIKAVIKPPGFAAGPILLDIVAGSIRRAVPLLLAQGVGLEVRLEAGAVVVQTRVGTKLSDAFKASAASDTVMSSIDFEVWARAEFAAHSRFVGNVGVHPVQGSVTQTLGQCNKLSVIPSGECCEQTALVLVAGEREVPNYLCTESTANMMWHQLTSDYSELVTALPCPPPVDLPQRRSMHFRWNDPLPPTIPAAATTFCTESAAGRAAHFLTVWADIEPRYAVLDVKKHKAMDAVRASLEYCLTACDEATHVDAPEGTISRVRFEACEAAVHWLPIDFGDTHNTCHLSMGTSTLSKDACFWGKCADDTTLYKVLRPGPTFQVNPQSDILPLYGTQNPNPLIATLLQTMAIECSGVITIWIGSLAEFGSVTDLLRNIIGYNKQATLLEVRVEPNAYAAVQKALSELITEMVSSACRRYTREYLTPTTMTRLDAVRLSSVV